MNSFETDMKRAVFSYGFIIAIILNTYIIFKFDVSSEIYKISIPVICTFPYTTAWLSDYQTGFIKLYITRTSIIAYSLGKILACGISGGLTVTIPLYIYNACNYIQEYNYIVIFLVGMLWSTLAATLAAISNSKYLAYGSSFVICYLLIILKERYFDKLYCLYPNEWLSPQHTWILDEIGIEMELAGFVIVIILTYCEVIRRYMSNA